MNERYIRPIHSEQDYTAALARVEALMDLDRSEAEDDELDVLATLIEVYEDRHFPMDSPDPIEAISEVLSGKRIRATGFRGEEWPHLTLNETYEVVQVVDGIFGNRPFVSVIGNLGKPTGLWHLSRFSFVEDE